MSNYSDPAVYREIVELGERAHYELADEDRVRTEDTPTGPEAAMARLLVDRLEMSDSPAFARHSA